MPNPLVSVATRCECCADDLESLKPFINPAFHAELRTTIRQLRNSAARLGPVSVPRPAALPCGDAPVSAGRGPL